MLCFRLNTSVVHNVNGIRQVSMYSLAAGNVVRCEKEKYYTSNVQKLFLCPLFDSNPSARGFKSDLKIKWVRPEKISCIKPEKSGDLKPLPEVDLKQFPLEYEKSQELKNADDLVKRVFSLEFMPKSKALEVARANMINTIKRHALDKSSMEVRITGMTAAIRNKQILMEKFHKNQRVKVQLKELIDKRKKFLKHLRRWDYKKFEWLLEKLDLVYRPSPDQFHRVTRKESLHKLTDKYCEDLKQERLAAYRETLESQKEKFLQEKADKLKWIIEEEKACGVEPTVSQSDVDLVLNQLKELQISKGTFAQS